MRVRVYINPLSMPGLVAGFLRSIPREAQLADVDRIDDVRVPIGMAVVVTDGGGEGVDGICV